MLKLILTLVAVIALVGAVLAATGVISVRSTDDKTSVTIDKEEMKSQANKAIERTKEIGGTMVEKASQAVHKAKESLRGSPEDHRSAAPSGASGPADPIQPAPDGGASKTP